MRGRGYTIYAVVLGSPTARAAQRRPRGSCSPGASLAYRVARRSSRTGTLRAARRSATARPPVPLVATPDARPLGAARPPARRAGRRARRRRCCRSAAASGSVEVEVWLDGKLLGTRPLVAARAVSRPGARRAASAGTPAGPRTIVWSWLLVIVTVTLNAAVDRTLTVPNFQLGQRHRASAGLTLAGGKGINVARALKRLEMPVVATGLAGGRTGTRIVEELASEGILNDFVRIGDESRTSTAVVDPTAATLDRDQRVGPAVEPDELADAAREAPLPLARRRASSSSRARCRAASTNDFYGEAIRDLNRRRRPGRARLRRRAAAARRRGGAVPRLAEPARGGGARRPGVQRRRRTS